MPKTNAFMSVFHENFLKVLKAFAICSIESPGPKDVPCQIPMHLNKWFMRRRFLKICQICPPFGPLNDPLRGQSLHFNKSKSPFPRYTSYQI